MRREAAKAILESLGDDDTFLSYVEFDMDEVDDEVFDLVFDELDAEARRLVAEIKAFLFLAAA